MSASVDIPARSSLTAKEEALFELLERHPGRLFSRGEILERVWGLDFGGDDRIVDAYVKRIRRKTGEHLIETVRGAGYRRPGAPPQQQSLPHYQHLSSDARMLLDLGRRILRVSSTDGVLQEVEATLASNLYLRGVALLTRPEGGAARMAMPWLVRGAAGSTGIPWSDLPPLEGHEPLYTAAWGQEHQPAALLPLAGADAVWGTLAVVGAPGVSWDVNIYAQLEAVASLVNPALRLNMEIDLRRTAEQELRVLNAGLEERVQQRTEQLLRSIQQAELLNLLTRQLEQAHTVPDLMRLGLPVLARLTGYAACAAWYPHADGPALACYRHDGTRFEGPAISPDMPGGISVSCDVLGQPLLIHAFDPAGGRGHSVESMPLLETAAQSLALNLSRHLHMQAMERTALTDEYTGLGNRQAFLNDLTSEVAYTARHGGGFVLTIVEVANIRFVNATVGYAGGNDLIAKLAQALDTCRRAEDRAYRLNGATFAAMLRIPAGLNRLDAVRGWQDRLRGTLNDFVTGAPFRIELLVADTVCPEDGASVSELFKRALEGLQTPPGAASADRRYYG
ncbi:diguanylate cyclase [Deinococcus sp. KSM4-11]|uniref:winged helix-turn-helix domain-containing protein n=1 Tax=Deinococcus sp. KSM4-11 TaxID=2568654 RepID=UPI0010A3BE6B|nr:winged helix-turn-helix domain-containing protein [Deinococcus sp. KSM4-11]THF88136.1 diguanylate cyclase [Deinococcus sp. KSM4-11]